MKENQFFVDSEKLSPKALARENQIEEEFSQ